MEAIIEETVVNTQTQSVDTVGNLVIKKECAGKGNEKSMGIFITLNRMNTVRTTMKTVAVICFIFQVTAGM